MKRTLRWVAGAWLGGFVALLSNGCTGSGDGGTLTAQTSSSCMQCHNGTLAGNYSGPGIENPHPFPGAENIGCEVCHGGNPSGHDKDSSHVPPPPEIGDRARQATNRFAFFNRLTLTGIDKLPNYQVSGRTYTALEYLQFINPGDLRVVDQGRGCGSCHADHGAVVGDSILATSAGIFSGAKYAIGADVDTPESDGLYEDTAADLSFRAAHGQRRLARAARRSAAPARGTRLQRAQRLEPRRDPQQRRVPRGEHQRRRDCPTGASCPTRSSSTS